MNKMQKYPIQKFLGLIILYAVIIVGIFVLQFKTESVLSRNIGNIRLSLAQTQTESNEMKLKNQFQVNFGALTFSATETSPLIVSDSAENSNTHTLTLASFEEEPSALRLIFTDGTVLLFMQTGSNDTPELHVSAFIRNGQKLFLPYKIASNYTVTEESAGRILLENKEQLFAFSAPLFANGTLTLSTTDTTAFFAPYSPDTYFEFTQVIGAENANVETYNSLIKQFRNTLVTRFTQNQRNAGQVSETQVVSYIAEMASLGRYLEALRVTDSFKRGGRRTFISAPYFGSLSAMDRSLALDLERLNQMVSAAVNQENLDIFTVERIADYVLIEKKKSSIVALLNFPSQMESFAPTLMQAAGIIDTYTKVRKSDSALAAPLQQIAEQCASLLAHSSSLLEDGTLIIEENSIPLSTEQQLRVGQALVSLGQASSRQEYTDAGHIFVVQALKEMQDIPLQTLADLYPSLVPENHYYPHAEILGYYGEDAVWGWTCANSIAYVPQSDGSINISMDFSQGSIHHVIFKNVPQFHPSGSHSTGVFIQGLDYRAAADFENWEAFGYAYQSENHTFLLKALHKARIETITLYGTASQSFQTR